MADVSWTMLLPYSLCVNDLMTTKNWCMFGAPGPQCGKLSLLAKTKDESLYKGSVIDIIALSNYNPVRLDATFHQSSMWQAVYESAYPEITLENSPTSMKTTQVGAWIVDHYCHHYPIQNVKTVISFDNHTIHTELDCIGVREGGRV